MPVITSWWRSSMTQTRKPIRQRILILVSFVSFFGSSAYGAINLIKTSLNQPPENTARASESVPSARDLQGAQLKMQEHDYQVILKQEPDNQVALKRLVQVRLQMNNTKDAVQPLQKLVQLNPDKQEYKTLLAQVIQQVGKSKY